MVIDHQKERAMIKNKDERDQIPMIPIDNSKGRFLFSLSPNDLVYVPTEEELEYPHYVDFDNLAKEQASRIFPVNDFSDHTIYFSQNSFAKAIGPKEADLSFDNKKNKLSGSYDNKTASTEGISIKERCWKLSVDRLGNVRRVGDN